MLSVVKEEVAAGRRAIPGVSSRKRITADDPPRRVRRGEWWALSAEG
ncbi:hypothetical protein GJR88_01607 [Dietzia sp. DQ12-45-1b]|nr:hypothetical protein GJR88_01607 [Dietzia sp. DQ12-45-1b]